MSGATPYPHVNALLDYLLAQMQAILGDKLIGLYLYGSLVTGDFDDISDVDLLAVLSSALDNAEFSALKRLHLAIAAQQPQWEERIEIAYLTREALKTFRTHSSPIAVISPGEPFHFKDAGKDWLMNWYMVRERGRTLFGLPSRTIIDPITHEEFVQAVRLHTLAWREWIKDARDIPDQAYAILTVCRGFYTLRHGEQVSKQQAADWAAKELPMWASLIQKALVWRRHWREPGVDAQTMLTETQRFVNTMIDLALG
jgi:hypothetical protein